MSAKKIQQAVLDSLAESNEVRSEDYLSTGSTLLNLACSGSIHGGFAKGKYFWIVGSSSSGKTFITLTALAEATLNPNFNDYELVFDNVEDGALMEVERYFGPRLAERLRPPKYDADGDPVYSRTIEDFYFELDDRLQLIKKGKAKPFIWLLDSMDALSSVYEGKKFEEKKKAARNSEKAAGDYGDGKAKVTSTYIRRILGDLRDTGSILLVVSQTRDNIAGGMFDPKEVVAGGRALKFYATLQLWTKAKSPEKIKVHGKERQIGIICRASVKKNRLTGKEWSVDIPIYQSTGIDDVGSMVNFLLEEKRWKKDSTGNIFATDLDIEGRTDEVIKQIEDGNLENHLRLIVVEVWKDIEAQCAVERKSRYH